MLLDLIALAILGVFVLMGALRGGVASLMGLLTLVLSYAAAVWAAQSLGGAVSENLGVSPLFGPLFPYPSRKPPRRPRTSMTNEPSVSYQFLRDGPRTGSRQPPE